MNAKELSCLTFHLIHFSTYPGKYLRVLVVKLEQDVNGQLLHRNLHLKYLKEKNVLESNSDR